MADKDPGGGGHPGDPGELMTDGCSSCLFMRTLADSTMHCRRYAPNAPGQGNQPYVWPEVTSAGWCGEGRDVTTGRQFAEPATPTYQLRMPVTGKKG